METYAKLYPEASSDGVSSFDQTLLPYESAIVSDSLQRVRLT